MLKRDVIFHLLGFVKRNQRNLKHLVQAKLRTLFPKMEELITFKEHMPQVFFSFLSNSYQLDSNSFVNSGFKYFLDSKAI